MLVAVALAFARPTALVSERTCRYADGESRYRMPRVAMLTSQEAGQSVAQWCIGAGREQATVAVSPASTLAGAMGDFWSVARSFATEEGQAGRQRVLAFPFLSTMADAQLFQHICRHIDECSELCEHLGQSMLFAGRHPASPCQEGETLAAPYPMVLLRSFEQVAPVPTARLKPPTALSPRGVIPQRPTALAPRGVIPQRSRALPTSTAASLPAGLMRRP